LEHHGHGRSDGQRALVKSWDLLCTHALEFLESIANKYPDDKLFLMGHSMGGKIPSQGMHSIRKTRSTHAVPARSAA
jgi:alpha-beta hydrolase superfamily lysophospholipase